MEKNNAGTEKRIKNREEAIRSYRTKGELESKLMDLYESGSYDEDFSIVMTKEQFCKWAKLENETDINTIDTIIKKLATTAFEFDYVTDNAEGTSMIKTLSAWETSECAETGVVTIRMTANPLMAILFNK